MNGPDISNASMLIQLFVALGMVMLTTFVFGAGLVGISHRLGIERNLETQLCVDFSTFRGQMTVVMLIMAIFLLHIVQISIYAVFYFITHALPTVAKCFYFSTITYGTIGYDDKDMAGAWQIVAAIEGVNGIILLGWSTAFIVTALGRISRHGG